MANWTPPTIPGRLPGWEHAYALELQRQSDTPFAWGAADCIARVADLCEVMTGVNPFPGEYRRHSTEIGATRLMKRLGFDSLEAALGAVFEETARAKARRGDCGVGEVRIAGQMVASTFIVMGVNALGSNARGPVVVPTFALKKTFRIG